MLDIAVEVLVEFAKVVGFHFVECAADYWQILFEGGLSRSRSAAAEGARVDRLRNWNDKLRRSMPVVSPSRTPRLASVRSD